MTRLSILFIGTADKHLLEKLAAEEFDVRYVAANREEIWDKARLLKTGDTGYYMSKRMKALLAEAKSVKSHYTIVRSSLSFGMRIVQALPDKKRKDLLLDFGRPLGANEQLPLLRLGCQASNIITRRYGESAIDHITSDHPPWCATCAITMTKAQGSFACPACDGTRGYRA